MGDTAEAVIEILRSDSGDPRELRARLLDALPPSTDLDERTVDLLARALRGGLGDEQLSINADVQGNLDFWGTLRDRFPSAPRLRAIHADTLLLIGRPEQAGDEFLEAFAIEPRVMYAFGGELRDLFEGRGGMPWALYRAATARAAELHDANGNRQYVREVTDELLAEFRDDAAALRSILAMLRAGGTGPPAS